MPGTHALLSASSSHKWLVCQPSAKLESVIHDEGSSYAAEGTEAHALAEKRLRHFLDKGKLSARKPKEVSQEMWDATGQYVDICVEKIGEARAASPDAEIFVERRLDFSPWVPEGFGTGDLVLVSDKYIEVVDLKFGKGVEVAAKGNPQMRLYGLGAYNELGMLYGAKNIRMTIVQPRLDHVETEELSLEELLSWGETIKPLAKKAFNGEGELVPGKHCQSAFCRCRNTCRAFSEYMLSGIKTDFASSELMPEEIANIILKAKAVKKWLESVEEYALAKALNGEKWPGLKLVEGRSNRKITDEEEAAKLLREAGFADEVIYKPQALQTLTDLEKLVGKAKLGKLLAKIIEKPKGKPTLASVEDKRPALDIKPVSKSDFDDDLDDEEEIPF